ncbi:MAG: hypothetical protein L0Z62_13700, partial [Gemmataceae bacterium]|nr:hypothetical protein [Gemmataceae bacterium]
EEAKPDDKKVKPEEAKPDDKKVKPEEAKPDDKKKGKGASLNPERSRYFAAVGQVDARVEGRLFLRRAHVYFSRES